MSETLNYDMVVIGSGPGGQKAAVQGAKAGLRVALVERERKVGGACVFQGTIPSKTLREAALALQQLKRNAAAFNVGLKDNMEVAMLMERVDTVLKAHTRYMAEHLFSNGIDCYHGRARMTGPNEVKVAGVKGAGKTIQARHIVLATGSRPRTPSNIPVDHEHILDSDSILSMIYVPRSLTVLGGGVISTEYASIFSALGVKVTIVDKAPRPLMFMDPELTEVFLRHFERDGGRYLGEQEIVSVRWDGVSQVVTELKTGEVIKSDKMLVGLGRTANVEGLGLEEVGVELGSRGHVVVDEHYRTSLPHVLAVGDLIGPPALASCSMEQGRRAVCHALDLDPGHPFEMVPIGIYAVPELSSVGLSEEQARDKYASVVVGRAHFKEIARGQIAGIQDGLLKLVVNGENSELLGVQIVGEGATDLIHVGEMALLNGNGIQIFLENILNFPTLGEAYRVASLNALNIIRQLRNPAKKSSPSSSEGTEFLEALMKKAA